MSKYQLYLNIIFPFTLAWLRLTLIRRLANAVMIAIVPIWSKYVGSMMSEYVLIANKNSYGLLLLVSKSRIYNRNSQRRYFLTVAVSPKTRRCFSCKWLWGTTFKVSAFAMCPIFCDLLYWSHSNRYASSISRHRANQKNTWFGFTYECLCRQVCAASEYRWYLWIHLISVIFSSILERKKSQICVDLARFLWSRKWWSTDPFIFNGVILCEKAFNSIIASESCIFEIITVSCKNSWEIILNILSAVW